VKYPVWGNQLLQKIHEGGTLLWLLSFYRKEVLEPQAFSRVWARRPRRWFGDLRFHVLGLVLWQPIRRRFELLLRNAVAHLIDRLTHRIEQWKINAITQMRTSKRKIRCLKDGLLGYCWPHVWVCKALIILLHKITYRTKPYSDPSPYPQSQTLLLESYLLMQFCDYGSLFWW